MSAAVVAKVMAKKGKPARSVEIEAASIVRFLQTQSERNFVTAFAKGLATDDKNIEHYLTLWRAVKTLDKQNRTAMQSILGMKIDLTNILWAYRLKNFYGIVGDTAYGYLVPIRHRLTSGELAQIVQCKDVGTLQGVLENTVYGGVFHDFANPEEHLAQAMAGKYKTAGKTSHIAMVCGYLSSME